MKKNTQKILNKLIWVWDYYFVYFLYNSNKFDRYQTYMKEKYKNYGK